MISTADRASIDCYRSSRVVVYTAPTVEPVTVEDAHLHLRVDSTADDVLIYNLIIAARQRVEADTDRALITQTWDIYCDEFPASNAPFLVRGGTLQTVTSVTSYDESNVAATFASASYIADVASQPGRIVLNSTYSWPTDLRDANACVVRAVVGYGLPVAVPQQLKQAILLVVATMYEHREQVTVSQFAGQFIELPRGYADCIAPYRICLGG